MSDMDVANAAVYLLASQLDGIEELRKATDNRFRQATRDVEDSDGITRGLGLPADSPDVAAVRATGEQLAKLEHAVILDLQRAMRRHPLGPWQKAQIGVGEKQLARLLASIGNPYWNTLHDRPRTVSELWAYCGLHTLPVTGHLPSDTQIGAAGDRTKLPAQGQLRPDAQYTATLSGGEPVAPHPAILDLSPIDEPRGAARRQKGQRANWSTDAKTRAYLIAESCVKQARSPYREVYDRRRVATAERVHDRPCPQCNGAGKTDLITSEWRPGHQHADALRIVSKAVLRDLWIAARDVQP